MKRILSLLSRAMRPHAFALTIALVVLSASVMFGALGTPARSRAEKPAARVQSKAVIRLDKQAYLAGETVKIVGSGFAPLESVMLQIKHADGTTESGEGHEGFWVYPGADGTFEASWNIRMDDRSGSRFVVSATGSSGAAAQNAFARMATISANRLGPETLQVNAFGFNPNQLVTIAINGQDALRTMSNESGQVSAILQTTEQSSARSFAIQATEPQSGLVSSVVIIDSDWFVVTDLQGADDVNSTQVDLNLMGSLNNSVNVKKFVAAWDATTDWTGTGQTGDICILYDTGNDGNVDYAICVRVANFGANPNDVRVVPQAPNIPAYVFTCTNARNDRCSQPTPVSLTVNDVVTGKFGFVAPNSDTMNAANSINDNLILESDPFTGCAKNAFAPACYNPPGPPHADTKDTVVEVHIKSSRIPTNANLVNICTYPSAGNGGNNNPFDCIVTPNSGFLVIKKDAGGDTNTSFGFTVGPPAPSAPQSATYAVKEGSPTQKVGIEVTTALKIAETTIPSGWKLSSATCQLSNGTNDPVTLDTATNSITGVEIQSGRVTTCTFSNQAIAPQLTVIKHVINNNGGTKTASNFTMNVTGSNVQPSSSFPGSESGTTVTLSPGSYSVDEGAVSGYTKLSSSADCSGTIALGETKTCTITNDDQPATLKVIKHVINDNGGTKTASNFTMSVTGGSPSPASFPGAESPGTSVTLNAGSYSVDENTVTGYTKTEASADCSGTIENGQTKTCTITNNDDAATLIVIKHVVNNHGGSNSAGDFMMTINGVTASGGNSFAGEESPGTTKTLTTVGSYNVTETGPDGYSSSSSADCSGTIALGQTKTCTITNDDKPAHLIVIKHVVNDNGGTKSAADFTMTINSVTAQGGNSFAGAEAPGTDKTLTSVGAYSVTESNLPGYLSQSSEDCSGTIKLGETKTCTITNDDKQGTVMPKTIQKAELHDTVHLEGYKNPEGKTRGTVTFSLFSDNQCTAPVGTPEVVTVDTAGNAATSKGVSITPGAVATYYWRVSFSGDDFNAPDPGACDESTTISAVNN